MPRPPEFRPELARFKRDKAYSLAYNKLRENGGVPTPGEIDDLAARYRAEELAAQSQAADLDLAAVQKGVNARVKASRKRKGGGGLPTPRQALRAQRARQEGAKGVEGA